MFYSFMRRTEKNTFLSFEGTIERLKSGENGLEPVQ